MLLPEANGSAEEAKERFLLLLRFWLARGGGVASGYRGYKETPRGEYKAHTRGTSRSSRKHSENWDPNLGTWTVAIKVHLKENTYVKTCMSRCIYRRRHRCRWRQIDS